MSEAIEPLNGSTNWMMAGACKDQPWDTFFPGPQHIKSLRAVQARAKAICQRCDVLDACLAYALENDIRHGIWGGLTEKERWQIRGCFPPVITRRSPGQAVSSGCNVGTSADAQKPGQCANTPGPETPAKEVPHD